MLLCKLSQISYNLPHASNKLYAYVRLSPLGTFVLMVLSLSYFYVAKDLVATRATLE